MPEAQTTLSVNKDCIESAKWSKERRDKTPERPKDRPNSMKFNMSSNLNNNIFICHWLPKQHIFSDIALLPAG